MFDRCFGQNLTHSIGPEILDASTCSSFFKTVASDSFDPKALHAVVQPDNTDTIAETSETVRYFKSHLSYDDDASDPMSLFNIAAEIMIKTKQVWRLKRESLVFFQLLKKSNPSEFDALLTTLSILSDPQGHALFLKSHHIDMVITSLRKQRDLPEKALEKLTEYLGAQDLNITTILASLRNEHSSEIEHQAERYHLSHHNTVHAFRIKTHAMHLIRAKLSSSPCKTNTFLQDIYEFSIEYHDHEQRNKGIHDCVEETTAYRITDWLTTALDLVRPLPGLLMRFFCPRQPTTVSAPCIQSILDILNDFIVKLGTTTLFVKDAAPGKEQNQMMDLSQLFLLFESTAQKANIPLYHHTNLSFFNDLKAIMLITGICDKNPTALYDVVVLLAKEPTLSMIAQYTGEPSVLINFFNSPDFRSYFNSSDFPETSHQIDQQAFLTAFVPHLRMRSELSVKNAALSANAIKLTNLIADCDKHHASNSDPAIFMEWFSKAFDPKEMRPIFENLFFTSTEDQPCGLERESRFCESQVGTLMFARDELQKLGWPQAIEPTVPRTDAHNLRAFSDFYHTLDDIQKETLIKELLLSAIHNPSPSPDDTPESTLELERPICK
ncbi:MAG: hypothetical protein NXI01_00955 [Gammaproteobacteria bacterium]|nr:hypothetical protein [Gammaproteobacteria bacterium]